MVSKRAIAKTQAKIFSIVSSSTTGVFSQKAFRLAFFFQQKNLPMGGFSGLYNMVIFKNLFLAKALRNAQPVFPVSCKRD